MIIRGTGKGTIYTPGAGRRRDRAWRKGLSLEMKGSNERLPSGVLPWSNSIHRTPTSGPGSNGAPEVAELRTFVNFFFFLLLLLLFFILLFAFLLSIYLFLFSSSFFLFFLFLVCLLITVTFSAPESRLVGDTLDFLRWVGWSCSPVGSGVSELHCACRTPEIYLLFDFSYRSPGSLGSTVQSYESKNRFPRRDPRHLVQ